MKERHKVWAKLYLQRWAELFIALQDEEQIEVIFDPSGFAAQALAAKAGKHANEILRVT